MKKFMTGLILVAFFCAWNLSVAQDEPETEGADMVEMKKEAATAAALEWLALLDEGDFDASWEGAASYFKNVITQENWRTAINGVRTPLGAVISRELSTATYSTDMPGAPDGEYVVIQFATSFENKKESIETITPMMDEDGQWRVSGYFIN